MSSAALVMNYSVRLHIYLNKSDDFFSWMKDLNLVVAPPLYGYTKQLDESEFVFNSKTLGFLDC